MVHTHEEYFIIDDIESSAMTTMYNPLMDSNVIFQFGGRQDMQFQLWGGVVSTIRTHQTGKQRFEHDRSTLQRDAPLL